MRKPTVVFVGDPMCSWCYGFGPELDALRAAHVDTAEFRLMVGGLRRDRARIDARMRSYLRDAWTQVGRRTGREFRFDILETELVYDTEPACRAVVAARLLADEDAAFSYFDAAQRAFYRENRSPQSTDTWVDLAVDQGLDADRFLSAFESDAMKKATINDFAESRELGITGYPAVMASCGKNRRYLTLGFVEAPTLLDRLDQLIHRDDGSRIDCGN